MTRNTLVIPDADMVTGTVVPIYLAMGGGWQSSALFHMSCDGVLPRITAAIFADTQNEMPETYDYLSYLEERGKQAGIPLIRVTAGNLREDVYAKAGRGMQPSLPVRVRDLEGKLQRVNSYTCSYDYKRRPVEREVKRLCGPPGAWKRATVVQWIGYSLDEMSRMKPETGCRCGHKRAHTTSKRTGLDRGHILHGPCHECACPGWDPWRTNDWPLITRLQMTRRDCGKWITSHGYPLPERSACFHCPNRGNSHWRDLRDTKPQLWAQTVELDEFGRRGYNKLNGNAYLHQSGVPIAEADLRSRVQQLDEDKGVMPLFTDEDMDCDAGVCFT